MKRILSNVCLGTALIVLLPQPARADHHFMEVVEVFLGTGGSENAMYVELETQAGGQGSVNGHKVRLFNAAGTKVAEATFSTDYPGLPDGGRLIVGTSTFDDLFGSTPDATFDASPDIRAGGKACFVSTTFGVIDCVSWGNFAGMPTGSGDPFRPGEGIPLGATIGRDRFNAANPVDTDDSSSDFSFVDLSPAGTFGAVSTKPPAMEFAANQYPVLETAGSVNAQVVHPDAAPDVSYTAHVDMEPGSAEVDDYTDADQDVSLFNEVAEPVNVNIAEDAIFEGTETIDLTLRNPTGGAVLGNRLNARIKISDYEDDTDPPTSEITKPLHGQTYRRSNLGAIRGTSEDGVGDVAKVKAALRQTRTDGSCKWFNGDHFIVRGCSNKKFITITPSANGDWALLLFDPIPKSVGTNVRFYTAYSKAIDAAEPAPNVEAGSEAGRNANRFEIN